MLTQPLRISLVRASSSDLHTWFVLDLIGCIPYDWFTAQSIWNAIGRATVDATAAKNGTDPAKVASIARATRLTKLAKLMKLLLRVARAQTGRSADSISPMQWEGLMAIFHPAVLLALRKFVQFYLAAHFFACMQFLIATETRSGWLLDAYAQTAYATTNVADPQTSGMERLEMPQSLGVAYSLAVYHTIGQMIMVHASVNMPTQPIEYWVTVAVSLIGAYWYASLMASVSASLLEKEKDRHEYRSRIGRVMAYSRAARLPTAMRSKLLFYYELCYPGGACFDEKGFLSELSRPLRRELLLHKCGPVLRPILITLSVDEQTEGPLAMAIVENLERQVYVAGDQVIEIGRTNASLHFVAAGNLEVLIPLPAAASPATSEASSGTSVSLVNGNASATPRMQRVAQLGAGDVFGESSLLKQGMQATATIRVVTYCESYMLTLAAFEHLVAEFPSFKNLMQRLAFSRAVKNANSARKETQKLRGSGCVPSPLQRRASRGNSLLQQRGNRVIMAAAAASSLSNSSESLAEASDSSARSNSPPASATSFSYIRRSYSSAKIKPAPSAAPL